MAELLYSILFFIQADTWVSGCDLILCKLISAVLSTGHMVPKFYLKCSSML